MARYVRILRVKKDGKGQITRQENGNKFYVHGTVHLSYTSFIKYQRDATFSVYLVFYNSTCFGRSLRPSSGVILQTVVTATGVYHRCGVE